VAWYREWFGEDYLDLYAHRDTREAHHHIDFAERVLCGARPGVVLDLACGAGRHSEVLAERGYRVVGVDLSLILLAQRPDLPRVRGDMRRLPFAGETFDWVLNFFTSFGYFESERENFQVLEEVARVLRPGGSFLIDLLNPEPAVAGLKPREQRQEEDRRIEIERWYDPASARINKRIRLQAAGSAPRTFLESVRAYRLEEVGNGLAWVGLEVRDRFGDFSGERYARDSERMILVARKPE
jgi:SAM-dependent methyltransferase